MSRLKFGTDGIRGQVGMPPFTPQGLVRIASGLAAWLGASDGPKRVVIGRDTRASGVWIEDLLAATLQAGGIDVIRLGVLATPAIAIGTREQGASLGIAVTASHNPYTDNGIKLFAPDGFKLSAEAEADIEQAIGSTETAPIADRPGSTVQVDGITGYIESVLASLPDSAQALDGLHIVLDCANGAASAYAADVLERCGARVEKIFADPDGVNINADCGATHTEALAAETVKRGAFAGVALDGDADRLIMVDETGREVDGDQIIALLARHMAGKDALPGGGVVSTVMSNLGLETFLAGLGLRLIRTPVGDRHVVAEMRAGGYGLGGEQSGHMILLEHATTGDGLLCALHVLAIARTASAPFSQVARVFEPVPQKLVNVRYAGGDPLAMDAVQDVIAGVSDRLGATGRVLVRKSGTEPLIRIMAESSDAAAMDDAIDKIRQAVEFAVSETG